VSATVADTIRRIQKISCFWYRLLPTDTPNVFSKIKKTQPGSEPARPRSELADPLLQRHALPYARDGDAGDEAAGAESERCAQHAHDELRHRARAREHLIHVAPEKVVMGPNLEAAMAYNPEEEGAPYWARREEHRCRCRWGRREERHGLHASARPHLRMPLPMGKKRGLPWSARSCAATPPSTIANVGEEGRSATADGEEEGSAAVASRLIDP
jgi:hypothetical protein